MNVYDQANRFDSYKLWYVELNLSFTPSLSFSLSTDMDAFEGSFFEDLRQLEFEEKAQVQSAPGTTLEVVSGSTVDPLGIYPNEESVDLSSLLAFDTYPVSAASGAKDTDSLAIVSSASTQNLLQQTCYSTAADEKSLNNTIDTSSWPHGGCSEVNDFSFRNYLPPTSTATHSLSMYDVSGIGTNPSNNMPVNIETVPNRRTPI